MRVRVFAAGLIMIGCIGSSTAGAVEPYQSLGAYRTRPSAARCEHHGRRVAEGRSTRALPA